jgi:dCMP deaminase
MDFTVAISKRDRHFLFLCEEVREQSHDPHRKVGAVVVDPGGEILSQGTNAPPSSLGLSLADSLEAIRRDSNWKYFVLEHAERNAIFAALLQGKSLAGATMYGTLFPCADCARAIAASGLSRLVVVGAALDPDRDKKWLDHYRHAESILKMADITVDIVDPDELTAIDPK